MLFWRGSNFSYFDILNSYFILGIIKNNNIKKLLNLSLFAHSSQNLTLFLLSLFISFQWLPSPHFLHPYTHSLLTPHSILTPTTALSLPPLSSAPGSLSYAPPHHPVPSPIPIAVPLQQRFRLASPPRKLLALPTPPKPFHGDGSLEFPSGSYWVAESFLLYFFFCFCRKTPDAVPEKTPKWVAVVAAALVHVFQCGNWLCVYVFDGCVWFRWSARAIKSYAMAELEARKIKFPNTGTEALLMGILVEGLLQYVFFNFSNSHEN